MEGRHVWLMIAASMLAVSLLSILSFGQACTDPHCMRVEDLPTVHPARLVRQNGLTGYATFPSGAVIEDVPERGGHPQPKRVKVRRYPVDLTVHTNVSLGYGDLLQFTHHDVKYIVSVTSFDQNNAQLKFMPTREFSNITPGENKVYDVDHDGTPDLGLTMGAVEGNQAAFEVIPGRESPDQGALSTPFLPSQSTPPAHPSAPSPPPPQATPSLPPPSGVSIPPYQPQGQIQPQGPAIPAIEAPSSVISEPASRPTSPTPSFSQTSLQEKTTLLTWGIILGFLGLLGLAGATVVVMRREQAHVDIVMDYILRSLGKKVPLSQAVEALGKAGWGKRTLDKALIAISTRYKIDGSQKAQSEDAIRSQLAGAGMPDEVLSKVFKNKPL